MRAAATALLEALDGRQRPLAARPFADHAARRWLPAGDEPWSWRFEGHHLSVTMTLAGGGISPAPVFLGANPARVSYAGRPVSRPLAAEEDLARELLDALGPAGRAVAVVAGQAPADIRTGTSPRAGEGIEPLGVAASGLGPAPRAVLGQLVALYTDRLAGPLATREAARVAAGELHFAWEGPVAPSTRHYYRVQGDDLLIEYDNTSEDGNHAHTVLRRPRSDFGDDVLARHYRQAHPRAAGTAGRGG